MNKALHKLFSLSVLTIFANATIMAAAKIDDSIVGATSSIQTLAVADTSRIVQNDTDEFQKKVSSLLAKTTYLYRTSTTSVTGSVDGTGDLVHGDRLLRLIGSKLPIFQAGISGGPQYDPKLYKLNMVSASDLRITINCSFWNSLSDYDTKPFLAIFFEEYVKGGLIGLDPLASNSFISVPMGLSFDVGYMRPPLPIDKHLTKKQLFDKLDKKWSNLIYGDKNAENSLLVTAYYSKGLDPKILSALIRSPYAKDKNVIFFAKGNKSSAKGNKSSIDKLSIEIGKAGRVVTTTEFVPDDQWHILAQLSDASVATGDSSSSDPFFFGSLPFWNCHTANEAYAWEITAKEWDIEKEIKDPVVRYISLLNDQRSKQDELIDFASKIDQNFMNKWQLFCAYIEKNFTLTAEKVHCIINLCTKMHLTTITIEEHQWTNDAEKEAAFSNLMKDFDEASSILSKNTIDLLKLHFDIKIKSPIKLDEKFKNGMYARYDKFWDRPKSSW